MNCDLHTNPAPITDVQTHSHTHQLGEGDGWGIREGWKREKKLLSPFSIKLCWEYVCVVCVFVCVCVVLTHSNLQPLAKTRGWEHPLHLIPFTYPSNTTNTDTHTNLSLIHTHIHSQSANRNKFWYIWMRLHYIYSPFTISFKKLQGNIYLHTRKLIEKDTFPFLGAYGMQKYVTFYIW